MSQAQTPGLDFNIQHVADNDPQYVGWIRTEFGGIATATGNSPDEVSQALLTNYYERMAAHWEDVSLSYALRFSTISNTATLDMLKDAVISDLALQGAPEWLRAKINGFYLKQLHRIQTSKQKANT